jgi:hypothetical protein
MRARRVGTARSARRLLAVAGAVALLAACGGDDDSDGTLDAIDATAAAAPTASPLVGGTGADATTVPAGEAGSGFVALRVEIATSGIAETVSLDRASLPAAALDPVSLDARCTPLDAGTSVAPVEVAVVDLRRLAGNRLVSAVLRFGEATPGEHEMTLEIGGVDQVTTTYSGTVRVEDGGLSGTFEGTSGAETAVTGSYACATEAIATTTTEPPPFDPEVPDDLPPTTEAAATTTLVP